MMKSLIINDLKDTKNFAKKFAKILKGGEVILLGGDLGAGKTTFTKAVLKCLGVKDEVTSPTFTIMRQYCGKKFKIYHFDMYRVTTWDDLYSTGFFDYIDNGVLVIEWSENIEGALPENAVKITISRGESDNQRIFEIEGAFD